jgi:hypothetical protein
MPHSPSLLKNFLIAALYCLLLSEASGAPLTAADAQRLTTSLDTMHEKGYVQSSVDVCQSIIPKATCTKEEWHAFLKGYAQRSSVNEKIWQYLNYPTFFWNSDDLHRNLQFALKTLSMETMETALRDHPANLPETLKTQRNVRENFHFAGIYLQAYQKNGLDSARGDELARFYGRLAKLYPVYFTSIRTFNRLSEPYMAVLRAQFQLNMKSALPLNPRRKQEIGDALKFTGTRRQVWDEFSVLIMDNNYFDERQVAQIRDFLRLIPRELHYLGAMSELEHLGGTGPTALSLSGDAWVNLFGVRVGASPQSSFPADIRPYMSDLFTVAMAHEYNHIVNSEYIKKIDSDYTREKILIARAGADSRQHIRFPFEKKKLTIFQEAPQEFFASLSNAYFADTQRMLEVGCLRCDKGFRGPLNQFLYIADIYSTGKNFTYGYRIDGAGVMSRERFSVTRGVKGRLTSVTTGTLRYVFDLDGEGFVREYRKVKNR